MSPRDWRLRLEDILDAIARILDYTQSHDYESFSADGQLVDSVQYNIIVLGEAARHVPPEVEARFPQVPWSQMRRIRNVVAHGYFAVNRRILWDTVQNDLPPLVPMLRQILDEGT